MLKKLFGWKFITFVVGIVALVITAPIIVGNTPILGWIVAVSLPLNADVRIGSASLAWWSPIELKNVTVLDADGKTVVQVAHLESSRTLIGLAFDGSDLGNFKIVSPKFHVAVKDGVTNFERMLIASTKYKDQNRKASNATSRNAVIVDVVDAEVEIAEVGQPEPWRIAVKQAQAQIPMDAAKSIRLAFEGQIHGPQPAKFDIEAFLFEHKGQAKANLAQFPSAIANSWLPPGSRVSGLIDGFCTVEWDQPAGMPLGATVVGELRGTNLLVRDPRMGQEQLTLDQLNLPCRLALQGQRVHIAQLAPSCELGKIDFAGSLDLGQPIVNLIQPGSKADIDLDLAKLAQRLPKTLHLHENLQIVSGRLVLQAKSQAKGDRTLVEANLVTSDLKGIRAGQPVSWTQPVRLAVVAHQEAQKLPRIDKLSCQSGFLNAVGSGSPEDAQVEVDVNLDKLAESLGQFVDFGPMKLAGRGKANLRIRTSPTEIVEVTGLSQFQNLAVNFPGRPGIVEPQLDLTIDAVIANNDFQRGSVGLKAGGDTGSVMRNSPDQPWDVKLDGDLSRWQSRIGWFTSALNGWKLAGQAQIAARVMENVAAYDCESLALNVRDLRCQSPGLWIAEPTVELKSGGRYLRQTGAMELKDTQMQCSSLAMSLTGVKASFPKEGGIQLAGTANFQGDVARIRSWQQDPKGPAQEPMAGLLRGQVIFQSESLGWGFTHNIAIDNLVVGPPQQPSWREARVQTTGAGKYEIARDSLKLEQVRLFSQFLNAEANGQIGQLSTKQILDVKGQIAYDLARIQPMLKPYLGAECRLEGQDTRPFQLVGPLSGDSAVSLKTGKGPISEMNGSASIAWKAARAWGCDLGPATIDAQLQGGWIRTKPIDTTLNNGKFHLEPSLRLEPLPREISIPAGPVIQKAQITPEMCKGGLGYALPMLARAAEAEGLLSVSLEGAKIPLEDTTKAEIRGTVTLHSARISSGPLFKELSILMRNPGTAHLQKEAVVPFQVTGGRVHHQNLELVFPDMTIRTSGSVGMDGSLALVAEMPVPPKWLPANLRNTAIGKQTIRLPLRGTVDQPKLDPQAMQSAMSQVLRDAAKDEVGNQIGNVLKGLVK